MTFEYQLWGHRILSDFDLGGLDPACEDGGEHGDLRIERTIDPRWSQQKAAPVLEHHHENGELWFACWKHGDGYVAHFPGVCSFLISSGEMRIECAPEPDARGVTIAHMILDHAIPRLLTLKPGHVVLHASAIAIEGQVVALLGQSGQGKSTLAAWLASREYPVLTDDCLALRWDAGEQEWLAQPSYESVRLWPDSVDALGINKTSLMDFAEYSTKKRTGKDAELRFATEGAPLRGCFALAGRDGDKETHSGPPAVHVLPVNEAFVALLGSVFRLDPENEQINRREFEAMTRLTERVGFWSLAYERKYDWLPEVQKAMIDALRSRNRELEKGNLY